MSKMSQAHYEENLRLQELQNEQEKKDKLKNLSTRLENAFNKIVKKVFNESWSYGNSSFW